MTFATKITVVRILLIPVFVAFAVYYGESIKNDQPNDSFRWAAIITFIVAALSDALDGFIARRFNQTSRLGTILDPIADKGLLLAAIITLTLSQWDVRFPIWFATLVIAKEVVTVTGAFVVNHLVGDVKIRPHWTGKACTFFQIFAVAWVMLSLPAHQYPVYLAALFTVTAFVVYVLAGAHQISSHDNHADASQ